MGFVVCRKKPQNTPPTYSIVASLGKRPVNKAPLVGIYGCAKRTSHRRYGLVTHPGSARSPDYVDMP